MSTATGLEIIAGPAQARFVVLRVRGVLDGNTTPALLERCHQVCSEARNLALNLSGVTFLGSSGVGAMLALTEQFQEQGCSVRFAALSSHAADVVGLLDLGQYLDIHGTE